jgi:hypothetical protein
MPPLGDGVQAAPIRAVPRVPESSGRFTRALDTAAGVGEDAR